MRVWILPLSFAALVLMYWTWVRPALHERQELKAFYESCDSFWLSIWMRIRKGWLMITAFVLAIAPELPGWLTEFGMLDLSLFLPSEWAFRATKIMALLAVMLRIYLGTPRAAPPSDDTVR